MYNLSLYAGLRVPIYTDYKESKEFEGMAVLLEKQAVGDTFFLADEYVKFDMKNPINQKLEWNEELKNVFTSTHACTYTRRFNLHIMKLRRGRNTDYNTMFEYVNYQKDYLHRRSYKCSFALKKVLRDIPIDYIVRYFQQYKKEIQPTIFNWEKWKVIFDDGRIAVRKVSYIVKNNPKEKNYIYELSELTTYNGKIKQN